MKAPIIQVIIAASLIMTASCDKKTAEEQIPPMNGGTATISLQSANDVLFPLLIQESNLRQISEHMLNPALISFAGDDSPVEMLASAWQVGLENTSITYILNSAYRWSDGSPISTRDVAFTYSVMQLPFFKVRMSDRFRVIRDIEIIDSLAFRVHFGRPVADPFYHSKIPLLPARWAGFQADPAALLSTYQENFIGCGPFILRHSSPDSLVLERNPYYPGAYPRLDRVIIFFYTGLDDLADRIRKAKADLVVDIPFSMINLVRETPGYEVRTYPERGYSFIAWNLRKPIFSDIGIRRVLTMAIDRDALINGILAGYARKIEGPVYPGSRDPNAESGQQVYDPRQAEHLLDQAGWHFDESVGMRVRNGRKFEFVLMINRENPVRKEIAVNIKANLAAIGIQVQIDIADWQHIRRKIKNKDFDALLLTWVDEDFYDPSEIFHSAGTDYGLNMMSYRNAVVDSLIEVGLNTADTELRDMVWREFQDRVAHDLPCTFLYNQEILCGLAKSLHEVQVGTGGYLVNVKEWWTSNR